MAYVLDTAGLPAGDRVEAVHTAMMYASAPCHVIHEDPARPVYARMGVWDLGDANIFTHRSSGIRLLRTAKLARQDAMPVIALSVQQRSTGFLEQGRAGPFVCARGELLGVDLSAAYDYSWSGDGAAGCLQIPVDRLGLPIDVIRSALGRLPASPLYRLVTTHITALSQNPDRITSDQSAATVAAASIDLCRALLASAARTDRHSSATRAVLAETLLTQIRAYVRQNLSDPDLTPARIATTHNISLRHLYKLCADAGLSLEQWIITERLQGARHDLLTPANRTRPIAAIARAWGFRDPTHFTRRFRARYNSTPSQLRASSTEARTPGDPVL
ncbi:helix-turn-helix domain-containing protein [Actinoplanes sp. CA-015351]|uniref:helix-turn-helix domain-containing protein n=1 Tax=Actinoplanes sp. CA-015351 TaxID=3239897 RepID=UPI003D964733